MLSTAEVRVVVVMESIPRELYEWRVGLGVVVRLCGVEEDEKAPLAER